MRPPSSSRFKLAATSAAIGFVLGAMAMAMLAWRFSAFVADERRPGPAGDGQRPVQARVAPLAVPPPVSPPPAPGRTRRRRSKPPRSRSCARGD